MQQILLGSMEYLKAGIIMNTPMTGEPRQLTTPNIALSADTPPPSARDADMPVFAVNTDGVIRTTSEKTLAPLFTQHAATDFRSRWDVVQKGFVDDPEEAVRAGDELVTQVIKSLSDSFSEQRSVLEGDMKTEKASTENRRLAFRRYRSFFERLLSI
ncbi:MAG: hypothetical protein ACLQJ0_01760 [Steroidobacteraceae bacterium]|jgi:hypothetical protein